MSSMVSSLLCASSVVEERQSSMSVSSRRLRRWWRRGMLIGVSFILYLYLVIDGCVLARRKSLNSFDALLLYYGAWDAQTQSRIGALPVIRRIIWTRRTKHATPSPYCAAHKHLPLSLPPTSHTFSFPQFFSPPSLWRILFDDNAFTAAPLHARGW